MQYTHIEDTAIRRWLQSEMESVHNRPAYPPELKHDILERLIDAEVFEKFIQVRYPGQKRFSLEGAETLIPAIHSLAELAPDVGVEEIVIGMTHRGRLNLLANILDKPYSQIFSEFDGNFIPDTIAGDGDVKYHKGFSSEHVQHFGDQKTVHLSLTANPSHLEAVGPVVEGRTRAKQRQRDDTPERKKVVPLLIHGDAAFIGQGLVAETMNLSQLKGYTTGGTIHLVINNQIGFTTDPSDSRTSHYCTDIAKSIQAPIFHVNGDDPEATVFTIQLALKFRQEFGKDVVVDMVCYRRHGHNESDEPRFTQPLLYKKLKDHPSVRNIYTEKLVKDGTFTEKEAVDIASEFERRLQQQFELARNEKPELKVDAYNEYWQGLAEPYSNRQIKTKVSKTRLLEVGKALTTVPEGFALNPKIARHLPDKYASISDDGNVDWALAELLAYGSLLQEGTPIRLSGQDSERGTFSHRHAVWQDMETDEHYIPLLNISEDQGKFCVYNSPLSEASVLGFEYGYSLVEPRMLIIWEAQFGDFANGAQPIIDQFITSSESKWQRSSGLVMLLPHGYEGQGPEHSNAYMERYLAAAAENNIQVCNLTTPAQFFHVLRRQMLQPYRRPLIIMSPKSMLRHKRAVSSIKELEQGHFQSVIDDAIDGKNVKRAVFCSGKIYWDLIQEYEASGRDDIAIIRVEQLYPISKSVLQPIIDKYRNVEDIVWVQEESKNRGGWFHMNALLNYIFPSKVIRYVGRSYTSSPATGSLKRHLGEQKFIVEAAIHGKPTSYDITPLAESELEE
ncbi:2-oxoglutarate dehydrogenase E1 component [bacterium BMS3Bbin04]|nr:2-oxoglutarate dehydrogenase E1 component [bacterium BMS3Bbin04]